MNTLVSRNREPIQLEGIENLAALNGAELAAVALSCNKHVHFVRLKEGTPAVATEDLIEDRLTVFTMGRDPFMLIDKMERIFKNKDIAKTCAFVASVVRINSLDTGDGKIGWELEIIGWWNPVRMLSHPGRSK